VQAVRALTCRGIQDHQRGLPGDDKGSVTCQTHIRQTALRQLTPLDSRSVTKHASNPLPHTHNSITAPITGVSIAID